MRASIHTCRKELVGRLEFLLCRSCSRQRSKSKANRTRPLLAFFSQFFTQSQTTQLFFTSTRIHSSLPPFHSLSFTCPTAPSPPARRTGLLPWAGRTEGRAWAGACRPSHYHHHHRRDRDRDRDRDRSALGLGCPSSHLRPLPLPQAPAPCPAPAQARPVPACPPRQRG